MNSVVGGGARRQEEKGDGSLAFAVMGKCKRTSSKFPSRFLYCSCSPSWPRSRSWPSHAHHVVLWNALGDAHHEVQFRLHGLQNGLGRKGRRHVDNGRVGARGGHCLAHCVEHWEPQVLCAALLRCNTRNLLGPRKEGRKEGMRRGEKREASMNCCSADDVCQGLGSQVLGAFLFWRQAMSKVRTAPFLGAEKNRPSTSEPAAAGNNGPSTLKRKRLVPLGERKQMAPADASGPSYCTSFQLFTLPPQTEESGQGTSGRVEDCGATFVPCLCRIQWPARCGRSHSCP